MGSIPVNAPMGLETRKQILPSVIPEGVGFLGPAYDPVDELPLPGQLGVREEGSMGATIDAVRAAAFYADMIGFGAASNPLTKGMRRQPTPLGVNYFVPTGFKCDNGADMYRYVKGIPTGNSVGKRAADAMRSAGFPALRGFAPGIMEDVQEAVNPAAMVGALFGSGYPRCKEVELPVGSAGGAIYNPDGAPLVDEPKTAYKKGGKWMQKRWVLERNVSKAEWECATKLYETGADGRAMALSRPVEPCRVGGAAEGFQGAAGAAGPLVPLIVTAGILGAVLIFSAGQRRR